GAFYREDLGYIDLVWGNLKGEGRGAKGWDLSKIFAKHLEDFKGFEGATPQEKMANGIAEIISKGYVVTNAGFETIISQDWGKEFRVGLSKGWFGKGDNRWIITAYKRIQSSTQNFDQVVAEFGMDTILPKGRC
ncbi:hypothetical protein ACFOPX_01730, partial [Helicobacter baculiformis]